MDLAAHQRKHRRSAALERDMHHLRTDCVGENAHRKMLVGADAG